MAVAISDEEFGTIAEALGWPRQRVFRLPYLVGFGGPSEPFVLDYRLTQLDEATKARALVKAAAILSAIELTRQDFFDLLPSVTRAGEIHKDEGKGYRDKLRVISDMREELARMVDFAVNPAVDDGDTIKVIG